MPNPTQILPASVAVLATLVLALVGPWALADDADAARVIRSAKILYDNKDYAGAKRSLEDILKKKPDHAEALFWTARCNEQLGDLITALKDYNRALEILRAQPDADESLKRQAIVASNRLDEGKKVLAKYAQLMEREAERFKGKNDYAYETVMTAVKQLQGSEIELKAAENFNSRRPPKDALEFKGHYYKRIDIPLSWHAAKRVCEEAGGHLACIETADENAFVTKLSKDATWIGGTDDERERDWKWVDGSPWKFTAWHRNQPDNAGGIENGLQISTEGRWNDLPSGTRISFICEWDR